MTTSTADRSLRVIQWTTGNIGKRRCTPSSGATTWSSSGCTHTARQGRVDAAELAGWPEPTGVSATNDVDALIALRPTPVVTTRCGRTSMSWSACSSG